MRRVEHTQRVARDGALLVGRHDQDAAAGAGDRDLRDRLREIHSRQAVGILVQRGT